MADDIEERFRKEIFRHMEDVKKQELSVEDDFNNQQQIYGNYAQIYDTYCIGDEYNGPKFTAKMVEELYPSQKDIKIFDYGCGTGLIADCLSELGYTNIDGLDPCKKLTDVARSKGKMTEIYHLGSEDDDSVIPSNKYDVVCSSAVFFGSLSYPGFKCIAKICRYLKQGGHIIICTGNNFVNFEDDPEYKIIKDLESNGKLKIKPTQIFENYRRPLDVTEGEKSIEGILLVYQIL